MKKQILLLAGSAVILASCGSNNNPAQTQAQIDSTVNAKMAQHDAENAAKNDSTLKAMEKEKAEAMSREHHQEKKREEHNNNNNSSTQNTPPVDNTPPPPPQTGLKAHSDQSQQNNTNNPASPTHGGGLKAHSDQNQGK